MTGSRLIKALMLGALIAPLSQITISMAAEKRVSKAGKAVVLMNYWRYRTRDCKSLKVTVKIARQPEHGTVVYKTVYRDPRSATSTDSTSGGRCNGQKIRATQMLYKPHRGYRGKDVVVLRAVGHQLGTDERFNIEVVK